MDQQTKKYFDEAMAAMAEEGVPEVNAKIIFAQGQVESNNFKSNVFKTDNNAYGMKMPTKRQTPYIKRASGIAVASEGGIPYAHYDSYSDSVKDIINWLKYKKVEWNEVADEDTYSAFLKKNNYYGPTQEQYAGMIRRYYSIVKDSAVAAYRKHPELSILTAVTFFSLVTYGIYRFAKAKKGA